MSLETTQLLQPALVTRQVMERRQFSFMMDDLLPARSPVNSISTTASSSPVSTIESDSSNDRDSLTCSPESQDKPTKTMRRTFFTAEQVRQLERVFARQQYVTSKEKGELAEQLNMTEDQVKVWFQNRRMKRKRKRAEETAYYSKLAYINSLTPPVSQPGIHGYSPYSPVFSSPVFPLPPPQAYHSYPVPPPRYGSFPIPSPSGPPPEYPGLPVFPPGRMCTRPDCDCGSLPPTSEVPPELFY